MGSSELPSPKEEPPAVLLNPGPECDRAETRGAERERQRLAKTLHDTVCQTLTGAYFQAQVVVKKLQGRCPEEAQQIAELADMIHQSVVELGDISRGLQSTDPRPAGRDVPS